MVRVPGADCIEKICDEYEEAHYIVVSYTHQTHYSDEEPGAGHVMFINMIKDDVAYFSESYRMYDREKGEYAEEGAPIVMDAAALAADHEKLYGDALGALMFVRDGLNTKRDPSKPRTTTSRPTTTLSTTLSTTSVTEALQATATTTAVTGVGASTASGTETTTGSVSQHEPMQYTDNRTALSYVVRDLAVKLSFSTDMELMIVMTSEAPTVRQMREKLPDFEITVRGVSGTPIPEDAKIGTNMILVVKHRDVNFIFDVSVKGDSGDGRVSSKEAREALQISSRLLSANGISDAQRIAYDINSDGKINTVDARLILRAAAHMITL